MSIYSIDDIGTGKTVKYKETKVKFKFGSGGSTSKKAPLKARAKKRKSVSKKSSRIGKSVLRKIF